MIESKSTPDPASKENLTLDVDGSGVVDSETAARLPVLRFLGIWSVGESLLRPRPLAGSPSCCVLSDSAPFCGRYCQYYFFGRKERGRHVAGGAAETMLEVVRAVDLPCS